MTDQTSGMGLLEAAARLVDQGMLLEAYEKALSAAKLAPQEAQRFLQELGPRLSAWLWSTGEYHTAVDLARRLTVAFPESGELMALLGDCYGREGNLIEAINTHHQAARMLPPDHAIVKRVANLNQKLFETLRSEWRGGE